MTSFFEKLKKGMEIEGLPSAKEDTEKDLPKEPIKEAKEPVKEPSVVLAPDKTKKKKKVKKVKKERKEKIVEEPFLAPAFAKATAGKKASKDEEKEEGFKKIEVKKEPAAAEAMVGKKEKVKKGWLEPEGELTVDVYQTEEEIIIQSAIAGVEPEDLDITIENDVVTIRGNRKKLFEEEKKNYFYQECYWGNFSRKIILPAEVDASRTQASMKNGILTIKIPKIERKKKRKIVVKE